MRVLDRPRHLKRLPELASLQSAARGPHRREIAIAAGAGILVSCVMNFALVRDFTTKIPGHYDGLLAAWEMSWHGHAITTQPSQLWQSNAHYPFDDGLAFHDALFGYGIPFGWIGSSPKAALIRYNLLFLFAYAMAFFGAWFLARELGFGPLASAVAGAAFAYAPWRLTQADHLHILSSGGIPLSIGLMLRGYRRRSVAAVIGGWLIATWQLSLGFSTGLVLAYVLGGLAAITGVWWLMHRVRIDVRLLLATLIGAGLFAGLAAVQSAPYLRVADEHPEAVHPVGAIRKLSPPPSGFLAAPEGNLVWGGVTAARRDRLVWPSEQSVFPGVLVVALAGMGLFTPVLGPWKKATLLIAIALALMLSMGFRSPVASVYGFVYEHAPGWKGIRTPGRLSAVVALALGVLAAGGAHLIAGALRRRRRAAAATALCVALTAGVLLEGAGSFPLYAAPPPPAAMKGLPGPQLHLPADPDHDMHYMFWSVGGFTKIVNGHAIFVPRDQAALRRDVAGFPEARSIEILRGLGVKIVVWHRDFAPGTPWFLVGSKLIEGLGITKREAGSVTIFRL